MALNVESIRVTQNVFLYKGIIAKMLTIRVTIEVTMQMMIAEIILNPWEEGGTEVVTKLWLYGFVLVLLLYLAIFNKDSAFE